MNRQHNQWGEYRRMRGHWSLFTFWQIPGRQPGKLGKQDRVAHEGLWPALGPPANPRISRRDRRTSSSHHRQPSTLRAYSCGYIHGARFSRSFRASGKCSLACSSVRKYGALASATISRSWPQFLHRYNSARLEIFIPRYSWLELVPLKLRHFSHDIKIS